MTKNKLQHKWYLSNEDRRINLFKSPKQPTTASWNISPSRKNAYTRVPSYIMRYHI